ncbi:hypothetical protein K2P56_00295 [Patescibacteria group bacterium]|nr:hypothetical protein [Patescibacteria group bacterium]
MTDNQQVPQDLPVDKELAERVTSLYAQVDQVLEELRVPDEEKKEVEKNLMEAIAADLLVRLGEKLSDEDKQSLASIGESLPPGSEPDLGAVAGFFREKFSQEELVHALAEATESVLVEFTEAMRR